MSEPAVDAMGLALEPVEAIGQGAGADARPTGFLPWGQLFAISVYWFGIQAIWGAYEFFGQKQVELMVGQSSRGLTIGIVETLGSLIALVVQPTAGVLSDYTTSRWGRRKGYIIVGATLDVVFLAGLALIALPEPAPGTWQGEALGTTPRLVAYVACYWLLQVSSNLAQGPFQGYVPDLVPERQVGTASGLMGVMRQVGLMFGAIVVAIGGAFNEWGAALVLVGLIELALAALTFVYVREGPTGKSRGERSWLDIVGEGWGTDVLRERAFLFMTAVRFLFLMGTGIFANVSIYWLENSLGVTDPGERGVWSVAGLGFVLVTAVISAPIAATLSNRVGRKPVVHAAIGFGIAAVVVLAAAPSTWLAIPGMALLGIATGAYLSVDWALMTEVIPLASSGRYMGLANIANSLAGPMGLLLAGIVMDAFTRSGAIEMGPRVGIALGTFLLAGAALALTRVHPARDPRRAGSPPAV